MNKHIDFVYLEAKRRELEAKGYKIAQMNMINGELNVIIIGSQRSKFDSLYPIFSRRQTSSGRLQRTKTRIFRGEQRLSIERKTSKINLQFFKDWKMYKERLKVAKLARRGKMTTIQVNHDEKPFDLGAMQWFNHQCNKPEDKYRNPLRDV